MKDKSNNAYAICHMPYASIFCMLPLEAFIRKIIRKIEDTLNDGPFGRHKFKAAMLMRKSIFVGSLLNKAETMIKMTKTELDK